MGSNVKKSQWLTEVPPKYPLQRSVRSCLHRRRFQLAAAGVLVALGIFVGRHFYHQFKPMVEPNVDFDPRASFEFRFEVSNQTWMNLYKVGSLCNVSRIAENGSEIKDLRLAASPDTPITLDRDSSQAYACLADFKSYRPDSVNLAVLIRFEQHLIPGHPWRRSMWVPFHIVMKSENAGRWMPGGAVSH